MSKNNFSVKYDSGAKVLEIGNVEIQDAVDILQLIDKFEKGAEESGGGKNPLRNR